jgi:hypothetical protein
MHWFTLIITGGDLGETLLALFSVKMYICTCFIYFRLHLILEFPHALPRESCTSWPVLPLKLRVWQWQRVLSGKDEPACVKLGDLSSVELSIQQQLSHWIKHVDCTITARWIGSFDFTRQVSIYSISSP